ncbi:MAG: toxin-antitoxin system HicB family antitoxin [Hungatella sp.]|nr:toxin-antitoxin system HicB family antitoxin [Hungatella sp.]
MRTLDYYMNLPYTKIIQEIHDESGHYFYGKILELDGCQSTGETLEELNANLKEAMEGYIEVMIENKMEIPEPVKEESLSGKFVIRVPKSLHRRLVVEAEREGVSLNQYAMYKLAR